MMNAEQITEAERKTFEQDAGALGFSTVRLVNCNPEPWDDYLEHNTGHRWGGWLARAHAQPSAAPGEAVKAFGEFLRVHPSIFLTGYEADDAALELARIALDFGKTPNEADRRVAATMGRAKVLRDMLELCIPWVREGVGADVERIAAIGASLEWTPSVLVSKLQDLVRDYDSEVARELRGRSGGNE